MGVTKLISFWEFGGQAEKWGAGLANLRLREHPLKGPCQEEKILLPGKIYATPD